MEKAKLIFMTMSFIFLVVGFGASVWLYTVIPDFMSICIMALFFVAAIWYGFNVWKLWKERNN